MAKKQTKSAGKTGSKYSPEFATKALATWAKLKAEGKTVGQVGQALGVHPSQLYFWKKRAEGKAAGAISGKTAPKIARQSERAKGVIARGFATRERPREDEVRGLKKEIEILKQEIEILTRTITVFARQRF